MTDVHWIVAVIGIGALTLPAWKSFRCLQQARKLLRWRRPSLKGLDGQRVTLCGEVRVAYPVKIQTLGDCLWHRHVVQAHIVHSRGSSTKTVSDVSHKAEFSLLLGAYEFVIADLPTHVYGAHYRRTDGGDKTFHSYWLPVVDHLTVLGRVRQKSSRGEIAKDPQVGLIYSIHTAENTALREIAKAGLGLAIVGAGLVALYYMLIGIR